MSAGKIGKLLLQQGLLNQDQLKQAEELRRQENLRLSTALVKLGHVNENVLATFLSKVYGISAVSLDGVDISPAVTELIPQSLCDKHLLVPLGMEGSKLTVAIADPTNVSAIDDVRFLSNRDVLVYISTESSIRKAIIRAYGGDENTEHTSMIDAEIGEEEIEDAGTGIVEVQQGEEVELDNAQDSTIKPTIRIINKILFEAFGRKVSDIHLEPFKSHSRVRFRIDGALHEVMRIPLQLKGSIPARIKVMSQLDISERRLPQDGRIQVKTKNRAMDVRVSILPTIYGEKVCMRLLAQGETTPDVAAIGFEQSQLDAFRTAANQPYGMLLVTGPTGSGKSTTLYAALSEINRPDVNISTVEDPVEYKMAGVNQVHVKEQIGFTFASALRSLLRQDPDAIMVGEIRDTETAEIAIKAALTGHMVFSTLHTNDAASTITRLVHMGIEPFLITSSLNLVQAQRLIRVLCKSCKVEEENVDPDQLRAAEVPPEWVGQFKVMKAKGCPACGNTGYKGRAGVFEVMPMTEKLREMVVRGSNSDELKLQAIRDGMITLRRSAVIKLYRGETSLHEVLNNTKSDGDV